MLDEARRLEILAALGVEVYVLRDAPRLDADDPRNGAAVVAASASVQGAPAQARLLIACTAEARRELQSRFAALVRALGLTPDQVEFLHADAAAAGPLPDTPAYLMLGAQAARACSAQLPLERQQSAAIAVVDDAVLRTRDGSGKRALWSALKPLARRLHTGVG